MATDPTAYVAAQFQTRRGGMGCMRWKVPPSHPGRADRNRLTLRMDVWCGQAAGGLTSQRHG